MPLNAPSLKNNRPSFTPYLSALGAWALAFGCSVGQGAFLMPGGVFLPVAGPVGSALGIVLGAAVMAVLAVNYHHLMNRFPGCGGTYTYIKRCFGYDHGFLNGWFLLLTYFSVLWANSCALSFISRTLLGTAFQFGFHYEIAGFEVYLGEILLSFLMLLLSAAVCLRRALSQKVQIALGFMLLVGAVVCFAGALFRHDAAAPLFEPAFAPGSRPSHGVFTILALAPWAYVGFESLSNSTEEAAFPLKRSFRILAVSLVTSAVVYAALVLLAVTALPEGCGSWPEYIARLGEYDGIASKPVFYAAYAALGGAGKLLIGIAAFGGVGTGLIGNYVALSRLMVSLSDDGILPAWFGRVEENHVPRHAILCILGVSLLLPFIGRVAISWIVDVTTIGATIAYSFASAAAWKSAREQKDALVEVTGLVGLVFSLFFTLAFLVPNLISVTTLGTESYLILAAWCFLGFVFFLLLLRRDREKRFGRSNVALIVMLATIIFTSIVWMKQSTDAAIERSFTSVQSFYMEKLENAGVDMVTAATKKPPFSYLRQSLGEVDAALSTASFIQIGLIVVTLAVLFAIYRRIQQREKQVEVEKALAEESSRAKTSFLSNMSHEIRTPMNAIIGLDNIALRNPNLQPQTREQLEKIGASAKHLLGLINDILDMSRIESGKMVLKSEEFSFREFLDQINIIINGQCVDKGLHYECHIVGRVADYYVGDDLKLKQVLINILGNAVKFTDAPGDVTLTVEQLSSGDGACTLRFRMRDTGIGMDREYIPKIFEAFSQEDATTTNRYGGSGLGMAITKNYVEMMGGTIEVESEKGVGSEFTVTVTMEPSARTAKLEQAEKLPENLRCLVVDDDEIACEHAQLVLQAIGIGADTLGNGEKALEALRAAHDGGRPYQLLLTDYKMPGMNGLELTRRLRRFDGGETAVIMLTGYNWDIIEDEALADGVNSIVAKPLFPDVLLRAVHGVLVREDAAAEAEAEEEPAAEAEAEPAAEGVLAGKRILMAEDVAQNAEILEDLLDLEDILSEHAENGERAVQMFAEKPAGYYDAILMDVRMPVKDGLTATSEIRALDRADAKTIPIIAMTANVFDEDVERTQQAGMNAHLSKPVEPERLYETLARLIGRK